MFCSLKHCNVPLTPIFLKELWLVMLLYLHTETDLWSTLHSTLTVEWAQYTFIFPSGCSHACINCRGKPSANTKLLFYLPVCLVLFLFSHLLYVLSLCVVSVTSDTDTFRSRKCILQAISLWFYMDVFLVLCVYCRSGWFWARWI